MARVKTKGLVSSKERIRLTTNGLYGPVSLSFWVKPTELTFRAPEVGMRRFTAPAALRALARAILREVPARKRGKR